MARYIKQGESIFIPFRYGVSITDSQLHLRMYKTVEMFKRYFPKKTEYDVLCEYTPIVRCKDCKHYNSNFRECKIKHHSDGDRLFRTYNDYCSDGERKDNERKAD